MLQILEPSMDSAAIVDPEFSIVRPAPAFTPAQYGQDDVREVHGGGFAY
jgi:hypothetical protein